MNDSPTDKTTQPASLKQKLLHLVTRRGFLGALILTLTGARARAQAPAGMASPTVLNFQGRLLDHSGQPADGMHSMGFNLYTVPTGGTAVWTETQQVQVKGGVYHVLLGSINPFGTVFQNNPALYLGVTVDSDPELQPRARLSTAPYATQASHALKADVATTLSDPTLLTPSGAIMLWHGSLDAIPAGWHLCDGTNSTPDLRDRFPVCAGRAWAVGDTGGSSAHTHSLSSHAHSIAHVHQGKTSDPKPHNNMRVNGGLPYGDGNFVWSVNGPDVSVALHDHTFTTGVANPDASGPPSVDKTGNTIATEPLVPFFALAYIMKL